MKVDVRLLRTDDDRFAFSSGDAELDRFFHKFASQNQFEVISGELGDRPSPVPMFLALGSIPRE